MRAVPLLIAFAAACGGSAATRSKPPDVTAEPDPDGPHKVAVTEQVQPYIDGKIVSAIVIGIFDDGKREVYGFSAAGAKPNGHSLFELGSATKPYTGLLLADAIQRREVELDMPVADLLPAGVTVPTRDKQVITLRHLALHASGLPRLPPSLFKTGDPQNPYAKYTEDDLYLDLGGTQLVAAPGEQIVFSNFGTGLLGFALGRKVGPGYAAAVTTRVIEPLKLRETYAGAVPAAAAARIVPGTTVDLKPTPRWTYQDTLAGSGSIVSCADDQLTFLEAQLDAAAGGKDKLRPQMRLAQEAQLQNTGDNESFGWQIDEDGRYWHNGSTAGYRAFISFDPKEHSAIVILAATSTTLVEWLAPAIYAVLDNQRKPPLVLPTPDQLARYAGAYDAGGDTLDIKVVDGRLVATLSGEAPYTFAPIGPATFWIDDLQIIVGFQVEGDKVTAAILRSGEQQIVAPRK